MVGIPFFLSFVSSHLTSLAAEASDVIPTALSRSQPCYQISSELGWHLPTPRDSSSLEPALQDLSSAQNESADETIVNLALPHEEVSTSEFFKHISAEMTEPRRMRCLLGWCGTRKLPPKPEAPTETSAAASLEFQAAQAGRSNIAGFVAY